MAKGYNKNKIVIPHNGSEESIPTTYTTLAGMVVRIKPVSQPAIDLIKHGVKYPDIPTYKAPVGDGKLVEIIPHDETTLETDEDKKAWAAYKEEYAKTDALVNKRIQDLIFLKGIDVDLPDNDDWVGDQEYVGIQVPTNPRERYIHYVRTEVLITPQDLVGAMEIVMQASHVPQEKLIEAQAAFQRAVEGTTTKQPESASEQVGQQ